ncbi:MAG: hypothetical protein J6M62_03650 [Selenomonadaceae bacterium]|nr:hypothetical protein [Selenomonadaceae bacterium]MBO6304161.1 hypothetical protein [Selenomonadaceae bacterium]
MNFSGVNLGGMNPATFMQNFNAFAKNFKGGDPQQMVQNLLNTGKMTQAQYNQLRATANKIMGTNM